MDWLRHAAEGMKPVRDVLRLELEQVVLDVVQLVVVERAGGLDVELEVLGDSEIESPLPNLVRVGSRQPRVLAQIDVVVVDALAQQGQLAVEPAFAKGRHHVVDEGGGAAPPCNEALADDVDAVDVEVGQVGDQGVGSVVVRQAGRPCRPATRACRVFRRARRQRPRSHGVARRRQRRTGDAAPAP